MPSKAAVKSFSELLRKELITTNIGVIEVDPGKVETEFSPVRFKGDVQRAKSEYTGAEALSAVDVAEIFVFGLTRRANTVIAETLALATCRRPRPISTASTNEPVSYVCVYNILKVSKK